MSSARRAWPAGAAWAAVAILMLGFTRRLPRTAPAVAALRAQEVESLCRREGYPLAALWERAGAMGLGAALLPAETLADLAADGSVLSFSKSEWEKWSALGLLAPGAQAKPGALWVRERAVWTRVLQAAAAAGVRVATNSAGGYFVAEFPERYDWSRLALVVGGAGARAVVRAGLAPVADAAGAEVHIRGRPARREGVALKAGLGAALRAAQSGPGRLIEFHLDPEAGLERNLEGLRALLRELRERGLLSHDARGAAARGPAQAAALGALLWLAPLAAVRAGLGALRSARRFVKSAAPQASPELELLCSVAAAAAAAATGGLAARLAAHAAGLGGGTFWSAWSVGAPVALAAASLAAPSDLPRDTMSEPLTPAGLLRLLLLAGFAYLALDVWFDPAARLLERVCDPVGSGLWWFPGRWREALAGFPCLLVAFDRVRRKWDCPDCESSPGDPRPWLLAGVLGPAGTVAALSNPAVPIGDALAHTAFLGASGAALGGALLWRLGRKRRV